VFLDDDAFERRYVREALPDVIVPELPPDPADWVRFLCELNLFEAASLSDEDRRRGALYRAETSRTEARAEYRDVGEYLQSLDMRIAVRRFDAAALPRVVQLLQRSNQFNLTTRRHVAPVCEAMMRDDACVPFYVSLADRFGDSGLVSVVILRRDGDVLGVDSWVMSCRVLGRGVEQFVMNKVFEAARGLGCRRVEGTYVPTAKNGMVREFYGGFGFERTAARDDGATTWSLAVDAYRPRDAHLQEVP